MLFNSEMLCYCFYFSVTLTFQVQSVVTAILLLLMYGSVSLCLGPACFCSPSYNFYAVLFSPVVRVLPLLLFLSCFFPIISNSSISFNFPAQLFVTILLQFSLSMILPAYLLFDLCLLTLPILLLYLLSQSGP